MVDAGEIDLDRFKGVLRGDATKLPFADDSFDVVITSEVLEHIQDDVAAIAEMVRVLKPGGHFAATVPAWFPEKINWMLSRRVPRPEERGWPRPHLQRDRADGASCAPPASTCRAATVPTRCTRRTGG